MNVLAEQASNQQTLRQQDIEKTRQQANEALRLMDSERQQLRAANKKYHLLFTYYFVFVLKEK